MPEDQRLEYAFYGKVPMIEFNHRTGRGRRVAVIKVDDIMSVQQVDSATTSVVLEDGRSLLADHPYSELRRIILEARSQFATLL
jgi:hypothetical protein